MNPSNPAITTKELPRKLVVAYIREIDCIGCTKCIQACPTDAILGSNKQLHTVIRDECIGCRLCVTPCPVDCIELHETPVQVFNADRARERVKARKQRKANQQQITAAAVDPKSYLQSVLSRVQKKI